MFIKSFLQDELSDFPFNWTWATIVSGKDKTLIYEKDNSWFIKECLPGLLKEHLKIELKDSILSVNYKHPDPKNEKNDFVNPWISYSKSWKVETNIKPDDISAEYKNGILLIVVKKRESSKPSQITVK